MASRVGDLVVVVGERAFCRVGVAGCRFVLVVLASGGEGGGWWIRESAAFKACCSGQKSPPQVSTLNSEWKKKSRLAGVRPVLISGKNHETRFI